MARRCPAIGIVRASCPDCGDLELRGDAVTSYWIRYPSGHEQMWLDFYCPQCNGFCSKQTYPQLFCELMEVGVKTTILRSTVPAEALEPRKPGSLVSDDLITLHNALDDDSAFHRITGV